MPKHAQYKNQNISVIYIFCRVHMIINNKAKNYQGIPQHTDDLLWDA